MAASGYKRRAPGPPPAPAAGVQTTARAMMDATAPTEEASAGGLASVLTVPLSAKRIARVYSYQNLPLVDIREVYFDAAGNAKPGKKGISLTLDQFQALTASGDAIIAALADLAAGSAATAVGHSAALGSPARPRTAATAALSPGGAHAGAGAAPAPVACATSPARRGSAAAAPGMRSSPAAMGTASPAATVYRSPGSTAAARRTAASPAAPLAPPAWSNPPLSAQRSRMEEFAYENGLL